MEQQQDIILNVFHNIDYRNYVKDPKSMSLSARYNMYDNVESLDIVRVNDNYKLNANVNVQERKTQCQMIIDEYGEVLSYDCKCPWCSEDSACAHIGAIILKLNQLDISSVPFHYVNSKKEERKAEDMRRIKELKEFQLRRQSATSRDLIEKNKNTYQINISTLFNDEKYSLEPIITIEKDKTIYLSFKVGLDKKYVVKNIDQFIADIDEHNEHSYGKNLSFIHALDAFDEFSQKQIEFMKHAYTFYSKQKRERYYYSYSNSILQKNIEIPTQLMDAFYDVYQGFEFDDFQFEERDMKVPFIMHSFEEYYIINYNGDEGIYLGDKSIYILTKRKKTFLMERVCLDQSGKTLQLLNAVAQDTVTILKDDYIDFYKYVLQPILEYVDIIGLIDIQENEYVLIKIYGDINEESQMYLEVYYINENNDKIQGFNTQVITNYQQDIVEEYLRKYASYIDLDKHIAYFDIDSEKTHEFIYEGIDRLREYADIYISDALKKIGQTTHYNISIGLKVSLDLLSLDVESSDIPKKELSNVLAHYKQRKKFYRLKNGELLALNSPQLEELERFMDQYHIDPREINSGHLELSKNRVFSINADANQFEHIQIERGQSFKNILDAFSNKKQSKTPIPPHYNNILRDYQKEGYSWMETLYQYGFNGILADDMGLGKTLQVITLIEALNSKCPSLVICPSSLIYNWEDEVHKFSNQLNVGCIVGNQNNRKEAIENASDYKLLVTSYDYMRRDYELYENITFEYVILDEAQYIKNQKTKNAISVKKLKANHKLALTGTPIENSLAELWSIMDFLMPQYLFNYHYFQKNYENDIIKNNDETKIIALKKLISPFVLRRNKKDVLTELPEKVEKTYTIPFSEEEKDLYYANLAQVNEELQSILKMEKVDKIAILAMLTRLRQICCEPRLIYENIKVNSSKMKACLDLISNFSSHNQKVLIFSSFTSVLSLLENELKLLGVSFFKLTGDTSKEERRRLVDKFQEGNADVFLISLKAGGTGLNLTMAEAVIHFDPWWNISAQNQATDRAYRIGQHNSVQVYKLVMKESIEEKILLLQEKKKELADMFVENNSGSISSMTNEDILALFS